MKELSKEETEQQDFVDFTVFNMMKSLAPAGTELKWDIKPISEIRDVITDYFVKDLKICTEKGFYPYMGE